MTNTRRTNLFAAAGLCAAIALGASACKEATAKTKGVGDSLRAFIVKNCETQERYCQVCTYGGRPTIMAIADLDDAGVEKDLVAIQKLVAENEKEGLTAFALFGHITDGKFIPVKDDDAATKKLAELKTRLGLTYPVTIVPSSYTEKEKKGYMPFVDQYTVPKSRTVFAAKADNKVFFADVMTGDAKQYEALATAVKAQL